MESRRRVTRGRPRKAESEVKKGASPARTKNISPATKRGSPARRVSPVRRSSRPRSVALGTTAPSTVVSPPSPIKEVKEKKSPKSSPNTRSNLPSTLTTNTSSRAPFKSTTMSSVHSSYSSTTQKTIEIRSSASADDKVVTKIKDYLRRSLSKGTGDSNRQGSHTPTTNTEFDSRYSRSVSRSVYDDDKSSKAEFSDNDEKKSTIAGDVIDEEDEHYKSFSATQHDGPAIATSPRSWRKLETPQEFGGVWGISFLLLTVPVLVYYLQWSCGKSSCDFKPIKLETLTNGKYLLDKVFPVDAVGAYLAYTSILFFLSGILYGRHVNITAELTKQVYNFNVLPLALLVTIGAGVAEYLKYPVADFVIRNYLRFCIYGFLNAFIIAFWCYIRAGIQLKDITSQINPYGKTGNFLVDFALGRQLNPKWFGFIDYKQAFYRISLISTLIFAVCFLYKKIQIPALPAEFSDSSNVLEVAKYYALNLHYDAGTVFAATLLLVYTIDMIVFEHHLASSFELQGEGFGCLLLLRYAATPYLLSAVAKYFYDRRMPSIACQFGMYVGFIVLLLGIILKRLSSAIKYKYRTNPHSEYFQGIESIHTFQGKRLLLDAVWGRLRQPNYAGDIIALWALIIPIFLRFSWPPLISIGLIILLLLHRTVRVNARNISRYHSSWVRYCTRVPNYVLPKIY